MQYNQQPRQAQHSTASTLGHNAAPMLPPSSGAAARAGQRCRLYGGLPRPPGCFRHAIMQRGDIASLSVRHYQEIIDQVTGRVRGEFNQEGIDE